MVNTPSLHREHLQLEVLDGLVISCLDVWQKKAGAADSAASLRQFVMEGHIQQAMSMLKGMCPQALQDLRLVFRLQRQQFIELVRNARHSHEEDLRALACARDQLAPLALDAYPEAYCDFKKLLTLLLYAKTPDPDQPADVREALDTGARQELAQIVDHTVRQHTGQQEPLLALLLTYLLRLYSMHMANSRASAAAQLGSEEQEHEKLVDALLGMGRDAAPLPPESGLGPSSFSEHDINALVHCAGCTRRDAVAALKRSNNDLLAAFKAELARLRLNKPLLHELLHEYIVYRGLRVDSHFPLEPLAPSPHPDAGSMQHTDNQGHNSGDNGASAMDVDGDGGRERLGRNLSRGAPGRGAQPQQQQQQQQQQQGEADVMGEPCFGEAGPLSCPSQAKEAAVEGIGRLSVGSQMRGERGGEGGREAASGGGREGWEPGDSGMDGQQGGGTHKAVLSVRQSAPRRSESQSPPGKVQRCHNGASPPTLLIPKQGPQEDAVDPKHKGLSMVLQLGKDGKPAQVYEAVEALDPGFFSSHPTLLFELRRCQLAGMLEQGDISGALALARSQLAPIAEKEPSLQPLLKVAMASFLPGGLAPTSSSQQPSLPSLMSSIQTALVSRLGMEGPRLIKLLQALLARHRAWTRHEKYSDPFVTDLCIDALRQPPTVLTGGSRGEAAGVAGASAAAGGGHSGSMPHPSAAPRASGADTVISDLSDDDVSLDGAIPEESVLRLIEILEVPRHQAIELLVQHEGDLEMAVVNFASL